MTYCTCKMPRVNDMPHDVGCPAFFPIKPKEERAPDADAWKDKEYAKRFNHSWEMDTPPSPEAPSEKTCSCGFTNYCGDCGGLIDAAREYQRGKDEERQKWREIISGVCESIKELQEARRTN
jgi:hypothetical protein